MKLTEHARERMQQRGIPMMLIDLLDQFGTTERAGGKCEKVFLDKQGKSAISAYAGPMARALEAHLNIYIVVSNEGAVVTTGHRTKRIRRV